MKNPLKIIGVVLVLVVGLTSSQEAFIYPGFAEVHEPVRLSGGSWTWFPEADLAGSLVDGTVRLLGVDELRRVWRNGAVTFYYRGSGDAQLAYLTRNLTYGLHYELDVDTGALVGWAKVRNGLGRPLTITRLTFVAGEVPLRSGSAPTMEKSARALALDVAASDAAPAPVYVGSGGGVYRYVLENPPVLEPGVNELPFLRASVQPVYTWRYQGGFARGDRLAFLRGYTFEAPARLAGGVVNLRDAGVFLGQAGLQNSAMGARVQLWLGADPEGRAERRIEVLKDEREEKAYRVSTAVRNPRDVPVRVEVEEYFNAREVELKLPASAERTPQGYRWMVVLQPGEARTFAYTVTLRY
ncbi:hypothetical protein [Oceanithermus sp.]